MLILVGRTCSGKDKIARELINMGYKKIVSYTTRPIRDEEKDGVDYKFILENEFLKLKEQGYFAETTSYNVEKGETWHYGISIQDLKNATKDTIVILNPEGLRQVKEIIGADVIDFYIEVQDEIIKERLKERGDNPKEAKRRLKADKKDFKGIENETNYIISNNYPETFERTVHQIDYIYKKHMQLKQLKRKFESNYKKGIINESNK